MARYEKKSSSDGNEDIKMLRTPRRYRAHKTAITVANHQDKHLGWGYSKRRTVFND